MNVLNAATMVWETRTPDPANPVPGPPADTGTYGRFRYIPSKNVYILVNDIDLPVYFTKLSPGGGTPVDPPDGNPLGGDGTGGGDPTTPSDAGGTTTAGDGDQPLAGAAGVLGGGCACSGFGSTPWALVAMALLRRRRRSGT